MLSQCLYWSQRSEGGWFYKSCAEWECETGLTRAEQETVRRELCKLDFFEEDRRGMPATMHYRVDIDLLEEAVIATKKDQFAEKPQTVKTRGLVGGNQAGKSAERSQTTLIEAKTTSENSTDTRADSLFEIEPDLPTEPFERWIVEQIRTVPAFASISINPDEIARLAVDIADCAPSDATLIASFKNWVDYEIGDTKHRPATKKYRPIARVRDHLLSRNAGRWAGEKSRNGTKPFDTMSFVRNLQGQSESTEDRALAILNGKGSFVR